MNFFKPMTALALAGVMSLSLLAGCQQQGGTSSSTSAPDGVPEVVDVNAIDDICVYLTGLKSDETVATVDGTKIAAGELMYWIAVNCDNLLNYYYYYGVTELPWDSTDESGENTLADFVLEDAVNYAALQRLLAKKGKSAGLTVSQENVAWFQVFFLDELGNFIRLTADINHSADVVVVPDNIAVGAQRANMQHFDIHGTSS